MKNRNHFGVGGGGGGMRGGGGRRKGLGKGCVRLSEDTTKTRDASFELST